MQGLRAELKKVIQDLYGLDFDPEITPSPDNIDADYSSNAPLKLAKELYKNPMEIAKEIDERLTWAGDGPGGGPPLSVSEVGEEKVRQDPPRTSVSAPGFLNFTLSDDYLRSSIESFNADFSSNEHKGQTVICEFSDPNPFKVLHVGHLYTSIVGDSIGRLFEYAGAKVIRANFGGDVGLHVAKTMYALRQKSPEELTIEDIAKCYVKGTAAYEEDETARREITKLNKEIYKINSDGLSHGRVTDLEGVPKNCRQFWGRRRSGRTRPENELTNLYWRGRELSYDYFNTFYDSIGVKFDKYYPESTVADLGMAKVKEQLKKGVYEYSDGAVIFNGDKYGLHTRVFINREGVPTYETKDVGLIFTKWEDYHFDKSVVITGSEQLEYMKVVLKSVEQYAPELVERTTHLTHGLVKLPGNVKMSSRKGNFLKAVDVLDMVREELKTAYNSSDETISLAATKYAFLKYKMGGDIIFDPKESVKMTGNSGPYLLYSCVRAKKILDKSGTARVADGPADLHRQVTALEGAAHGRVTSLEGDPQNVLRSKNFGGRNDGRTRPEDTTAGPVKRMSAKPRAERNLTKRLLDYTAVLDEAVTEMAPHKVANFLYELAQTFSRFYENCEVVGSDRESERLQLVKIYLAVMTHGLDILGIEIPEEM